MFKKLLKALCGIRKAFAARSTTSDPLSKYAFKMLIPGVDGGIGFSKVSGLSHETEVVNYAEGGEKHDRKMPGREKVGEVVAERGTYAGTTTYAIFKKTLTNPDMRNVITIIQQDRQGNPVRTWRLAEAWASKWEGPDFDASSSDIAIERITFQHEYFLD